MADINNIENLQDLRDVIEEYLKTPRTPPLSGAQLNIILTKTIEFTTPVNLSEAPVLVDEAAAVSAGLSSYKIYLTPTGEMRYKLPTGDEDYVLENYFIDGYTV